MTNTWDQSKFLEPICHPMTELETVQVLHSAWITLFNTEPSINSMGVLFAQWCLEVGIGAKFAKCYNFGNIKSSPTDGLCWTNFRCNEIIGGKEIWFDPPNDACKFRAFKTPTEGAVDYLKFLSQRKNYANAWTQVMAGNPAEYAHQLKLAHYYTADESLYTKGVVSLFNRFISKYSNTTSWQTPIVVHNESIDLSPEERAHIQGMVALSFSTQIQEYFSTARIDDGEEIDPTDNTYYTEVPSLWTKVKGIFGGNK